MATMVHWLQRTTMATAFGFLALVFLPVGTVNAQGAGGSGTEEATRVLPAGPGQVMWSFAPLVRDASPAVVNIFTKSVVGSRPDDFFSSPFGDSRERRDQALGSGVIVSVDGTVVTNAHVIQGADEIEVFLTNDDIYFADVLFKDERTDIAILQLQTQSGSDIAFPTLPIGDSDQVQVGDFVLAIGNPFGIGQSTSMGIVSAIDRTEVDVVETGSFIQTDAAINPGNSGGALIDLNGQLVGINSAILSRSGSSAGIGWAIPSNFVRSTLEALEATGGNLVRPWVGLTGDSLSRDLASALGLPNTGGVIIEEVAESSPGEVAGLREGDIVTAVDGKEIDNIEGLKFAFASKLVGEKIVLTVLAQGQATEMVLDLIAPPELPPRTPTLLTGRHPLEGATVINVSPAVIEEFGLRKVTQGVMVADVPRDSVAGRFNRVREGDVIVSMQGEAVDNVDDIVRLSGERTRRWTIEMIRNGRVIQFRATF